MEGEEEKERKPPPQPPPPATTAAATRSITLYNVAKTSLALSQVAATVQQPLFLPPSPPPPFLFSPADNSPFYER